MAMATDTLQFVDVDTGQNELHLKIAKLQAKVVLMKEKMTRQTLITKLRLDAEEDLMLEKHGPCGPLISRRGWGFRWCSCILHDDTANTVTL